MSRFAKKMWMITIWAGLGLLIGMQLANPSRASSIQPDISKVTTPKSAQEITVPLPQGIPNSGTAGSYTITVQANPAPTQKETISEQQQVDAPDYSDKTPQQILIPETSKPTVDVLADKTANLLQKASQEGIQFVVSLFSSATK
ncbi:hypothetical protein [Paenibacillus macquariensis]|uniref:Uncharacterized protein n=1 Tax=Paenibacillus macquariensis TaxID=948756 RepID=A0ABY1K1A2_9BACL|nr:hypothetical protein [Paenibacillus macquariensis]MEC0091834.1 hypothetical protein [Paenibacillus macquariensis]OAB32256.1 hypothetical protein PMSM_16730 [Paenibacillus macquariensis subsp. macquariensis]SIR11146.1 hypothetical protein SAMN05421578_10779 [Paenibacillus macquariensis]